MTRNNAYFRNPDFDQNIERIIFVLVERGYQVSKDGKLDYKAINTSTKEKINIIPEWSTFRIWHIGQVDKFTKSGKWISTPVPAGEYLNIKKS
jgi:hypothetical protein